MTLFEKISKSMTAVSEIVQSLLSQKEDGLLPTEKVMSLLEFSNNIMFSFYSKHSECLESLCMVISFCFDALNIVALSNMANSGS